MSPGASQETLDHVQTADDIFSHPDFDELRDVDKLKADFDAEDQVVDGLEQALDNDPTADGQQETTPATPEQEEIHRQIAQTYQNLTQPPASPPPTLPPTTNSFPINQRPPQQPTTTAAAPNPIDIVIVNRTVDAKKMARAAGEQKLSEKTHEKGIWNKVKNAVWTNGIAHEWYRQKYIRQAYNEIVQQQDVLAHTDSSQEARKKAEEFLFARFHAGEGYISKNDEVGEKREVLAQDSQVTKDLKDLVTRAVREGLSDDDIIAQFNEKTKDHQGEVTSQNILSVVESMRGAQLHGESLIYAVAQMRVIAGESRSASRTNAHYDFADKAIEWLAGKRGEKAGGDKKGLLGTWAVSEPVAAIGISVAYGVVKAARGTMLKATGLALIPGFTGATFGALRGRKRAKDETIQHERDVEFSKIFHETDKRRKKLDELMYGNKTAIELHDALLETSEKLEEDSSDEALKAALEALAQTEARLGLYDTGKVVIRWSSEAQRDEEMFNIRAARLVAEARITRKLSELDDATRGRLGIAGDATVDSILKSDNYIPRLVHEINSDIKEKDKDRQGYVRAEMGKYAAVGFALSFGGTLALDGATHLLFSETSAGAASPNMLDPHNAGIRMDNGYEATPHQNMFDIKDAHGNTVLSNIERNPDGTIKDPSVLDKLHQLGFHETPKVTPPEYQTIPISIDQYVTNHSHEMLRLHVSWEDNGTPSVYDYNEQGGRLIHNPDGTVTIGQNMTANGSFNSEGAIDMTRGQNALDMAFKQPDGTFLHKTFNYGQPIPKPWADMLYQKQDGTWGFKGNGHVSWGKLHGDSFQSAASIPGDGGGKIPDTILVKPAHTSYEISGPVQAGENTTWNPAFVMTASRNRLTPTEKMPPPDRENDHPGNGYEGGYYGRRLSEREEVWRRERSPRLLENPEADLDTGAELAWYREQQKERRGQEYIDEIDRNIDGPGAQELREIGDETKAIVSIPVSAENESDNIFNTLSLYAQQSPQARAATVILLNVNWQQVSESDPQKMEKINKTRSEIERARAAFPDLRIASFEKIWTPEFIQKRTASVNPVTGKANVTLYGEVIKVLYDTAAFAVERAVRENKRNTLSEAMIITNDADAQGISRNYLDRYINAMEQEPTADVFSGIIRWGTKEYKDYPGYGLSAGIYSVFSMVTQRPGGDRGLISTTGPNAGFRMSAYAAAGGCEDNDRQGVGADSVLGQRVIAARRDRMNNGISVRASASGYGSRSGYTNGSGAGGKNERRIAKHVAGAQLDTLADRLLTAYRQERWMASGWNTFDEGGYQSRNGLGNTNLISPENPAKDIDGIAERFKTNVEGFVNSWYRNPSDAQSALALYFGTKDGRGRSLYKTTWHGKPGWEGDGRFEFEFTPEGKRWLQERLLRDMKGRKDKYGDRIQRQLYNRTKRFGKKPISPVARFVEPKTA